MADNDPTELSPMPESAPAFDGTETVVPALREGPGTLLGPYKLLQLIGEGGFGSVFMAEQERPVARKVALKIIKLGMDTRQVVARFEQERQALAVLNHPNIAKVFDAGSTDSGRPYFVMELCTGEPISEYCDKNSLSIEDRLDLFAQVCHAVQHAHSKGIIHRDLKPGNVLVSLQDGGPSVKVIDFGIAKATASRLTERTVFTEFREIIGTPEYMSPEQAEGSLDIDTRTDIYALGVMLYELLTGTTPFSGKELRKAAYSEIQRIIREVEPPRPSTRLSSNTDTIATVAARRHTEPKRLGTMLRGDLDWIVMKALEKDRQRRYETANGLAMDIRRFLSGEAVLAAPPSANYRMKKFVRRHKVMVLAGSSVAAAVVLGLMGTIWQASVASGQRDLARTEAARAVAAETESRRRAEDLQRVADFQGAMLSQVDPAAAGVRLMTDVRVRFEAALTKAGAAEADRAVQLEQLAGQWGRVNATDVAREMIDSTILKPAVAAVEAQFKDQPAVAASLRHALAMRYHDLGLSANALDLEQQALTQRRDMLGEDHPDTLRSMDSVGIFLGAVGKKAEAEQCFRDVLGKSRHTLGDDHPETFNRIENLGVHLLGNFRVDEAEPFIRDSLEGRRRVLGDSHADVIESMDNMAKLLQYQGKLAEAETYRREVLSHFRRTLGNDHESTAAAIYELASLQTVRRNADEAAAGFRESLEIRRRLLGDVHPSTLRTAQALGSALTATGNAAEAESLIRDALDKQRTLLGPDNLATLTTMGNLSMFLLGQGRFAEAQVVAKETLERRTRMFGTDHPATLVAYNVMGLVHVRQKQFDEGAKYWKEAAAISRRIQGATHPDTLLYMQNLGGLFIEQKKTAEADELLQEVIRTGSPAIGSRHPIILSAIRRRSGLLIAQKLHAQAIELLTGAEADARTSYTGSSETELADFLSLLATARAAAAQFSDGEANLLEAHAIFTKTRGENHQKTIDCTKALADLYDRWNTADPGKGHDQKASEWSTKIPAQGKADSSK